MYRNFLDKTEFGQNRELLNQGITVVANIVVKNSLEIIVLASSW